MPQKRFKHPKPIPPTPAELETLLAPIYLDNYDLPKVLETLEEYGVVVLKNYFTSEQVATWKQGLIQWLQSISPPLTDDPETWIAKNLPYGPRLGMMQSLIPNCPTFWEVREAMYPLFCDLHQTEKLYTSLDGATIRPPLYEKKRKDWAHIDQTVEDLWCIQGQAVLSETTASFRCTPTSNRAHREILELCERVGDTSNWLLFKARHVRQLQKKFGPLWQVPIHSPAGSVILWHSNTIHSAQSNDPGDPGWRTVVYVCMRPSDQYSEEERSALGQAFLEGRTTNHYGTKIFFKRQGARHPVERNPTLEDYAEHPEKLALGVGENMKPTELMQKLVGLKAYEEQLDQ